MLFNDRVSWDRPAPGANDTLGHPAQGHAAGYPKVVYCSWQPARGTAKGLEGVKKALDIAAYSETFTSGRPGDLVTKDGEVFLVEAAAPQSAIFGGGIDHVAYGLSRIAPPISP